jgi:hypothetical protein
MLQTLEREPQESFHGLSQGGHPLGLGGVPHGGPHGKLLIFIHLLGILSIAKILANVFFKNRPTLYFKQGVLNDGD